MANLVSVWISLRKVTYLAVPLSVIWVFSAHLTLPQSSEVLLGPYQPVDAAPLIHPLSALLLPPCCRHCVNRWCQFNFASCATCISDLISLWKLETNVFNSSTKITPRIQLSSNIRSLAILPTAVCDALSWVHCTSEYLYLIILKKSDEMNCYSISLQCLWRVPFLGARDVIMNTSKFPASWYIHYLMRWPCDWTLHTWMEIIVWRHPTLPSSVRSTNSYCQEVFQGKSIVKIS